jgi:hypothetical protein
MLSSHSLDADIVVLWSDRYAKKLVSVTGRKWQREKGEAPETRCVGSLLVLYVCVCVFLLSLIDAERRSWRP